MGSWYALFWFLNNSASGLTHTKPGKHRAEALRLIRFLNEFVL